MEFAREINRLLAGLMVAFFMVAGAAAYWAVVGRDSILQREDNPRAVQREASIRRGSIYDRVDTMLAYSTSSDGNSVERRYLSPQASSTVGYFSLRYGVGGAEAAYDTVLRGDNTDSEWGDYWQQEILHRPQNGADIKLTLSSALQEYIVQLMAEYQGAVVVLSVPDGAVLAMVSLPSFDPNTLDEDWETLRDAPGNPFFNRVLQGRYQPGGMLQTPLMTAGILTNQPFEAVIADGDVAVQVGDIELSCALQPPGSDLTFVQAYAYACPRPFAMLAQSLNPAVIDNVLSGFRLESPPTLDGFVLELPQIGITPEATAETASEPPDSFAEALGQGVRTINPMGMAVLAAAVVNSGDAPQPFILSGIRPPDGIWQAQQPPGLTLPLMTQEAAQKIHELMVANINEGAASSARRQDMLIGGHAAVALSGEEIQSWFIGFANINEGQGIAVAVVLEDTGDVRQASSLGGEALEKAAIILRESP